MASPVKGYSITTPYGRKGSWGLGYHPGADFACPQGTNVYAVLDGVVKKAGWGGDYGYYLQVEHKYNGRTYHALYCHAKKGGLLVKVGQKVKAGQHIMESGATGRVTGPHLHFEVRVSPFTYSHAAVVNPSELINAKAGSSGGSTSNTGKAHSERYRVTADPSLNARTGPGTNYAIAANHPKGTIITTDRITNDGKWVRSNGSGNWYYKQYLELAPKNTPKPPASKPKEPTKHEKRYAITASALNARSGPGTNYDVKATHPRGTIVTTKLISGDGKWVQSNGSGHWYSLEYLELAPKGSTPSPEPEKPDVPANPDNPSEPPALPEDGGPQPLKNAVPGLNINILPRSAWTAEPDSRDDDLDPDGVQSLVVHWPGDDVPSRATWSALQVAEILRAWWLFHTATRGWKDIGYNYAVDMAGRCWDLTGDDIGAHAGTEGNDDIGVILVIGKDDVPSAAMLATVRALFAAKQPKFPKMKEVIGHQQVEGNATSCPGEHVMAALRAGKFGPSAGGVVGDIEPPESGTLPVVASTVNLIKNRMTPEGKTYVAPNGMTITTVKQGQWYKDRIDDIARAVVAARSDILFTQESGQYADAIDLVEQLDRFDNTGDWAYRLHGDAGDLTNSVLRDSDWVEIKGYKEETAGSHHNWATGSLLQHKITKVPVLNFTSHLEYRARGTSSASEWDKLREQQFEAMLKKISSLATSEAPAFGMSKLPVIIGLDANSSLEYVYDGPGRAANRHGFFDAEVVAQEKINVDWTTLNKLKSDPFEGVRVDRFFVNDLVRVLQIITTWLAPHTDHNMVTIHGQIEIP